MIKNKCLGVLALCLILAFFGCEKKIIAPLKIGTNAWLGYEPLYLALNQGYIQKEQIKIIEFTSATEELRAFKNGVIDIAALTLDEALIAAQYDPGVRVILIIDFSNGSDMLLARADIKTLEDLRHKRIGVEITALGSYEITRFLEISSWNRSDIAIVPLEVGDHEAAFKNGLVDAVLTYEPIASHIKSFGANKLFDSSQIPGEIVDVFVINEKVIKRPNFIFVKDFVRGWFSALNYMKISPKEAIKSMQLRLDLSEEDILKGCGGLIFPSKEEGFRFMTGTGNSLVNLVAMLAKNMEENKLLVKKPDVGSLIDEDLLKNIYQ